MEAREVTARLGEIHRVGGATGDGSLALLAAVIVQAMGDAEHGTPGSASDPARARDWLDSTGREWLEMLAHTPRDTATARARRVA
jgi:hypothetical protein